MLRTTLLTWTVVTAAASTLVAQPSLQEQLKDSGIGAHWIYDDIPQAIRQARATGKPIFALFR